MNKKVTLIIPVYNTGIYLDNCIDSLLSQTYENLEIVLIDDESNDPTTISLLEKYSTNNKIKIIYDKKSGVSKSRNLGLDIASGDYVSFIDSDDVVDKKFVEKLLEVLEKENADIAFSKFTPFYNQIEKTEQKIKYTVLDKNETLKNLFEEKIIGNTGGKLYKKDLLDGLRFDENISLLEDILFNNFAVIKSNKTVCVDGVSYYYRIHQSSISHNFNYERFLGLDTAVNKIADINKPEYSNRINSFLISSELQLANVLSKNKKLTKENYKRIKNTIKRIKTLFPGKLKFRRKQDKLMNVVFSFGRIVFVCLSRIYGNLYGR